MDPVEGGKPSPQHPCTRHQWPTVSVYRRCLVPFLTFCLPRPGISSIAHKANPLWENCRRSMPVWRILGFQNNLRVLCAWMPVEEVAASSGHSWRECQRDGLVYMERTYPAIVRAWMKSKWSGWYIQWFSKSSTRNSTFGGTQRGWIGLRSLPTTCAWGNLLQENGKWESGFLQRKYPDPTLQCQEPIFQFLYPNPRYSVGLAQARCEVRLWGVEDIWENVSVAHKESNR